MTPCRTSQYQYAMLCLFHNCIHWWIFFYQKLGLAQYQDIGKKHLLSSQNLNMSMKTANLQVSWGGDEMVMRWFLVRWLMNNPRMWRHNINTRCTSAAASVSWFISLSMLVRPQLTTWREVFIFSVHSETVIWEPCDDSPFPVLLCVGCVRVRASRSPSSPFRCPLE